MHINWISQKLFRGKIFIPLLLLLLFIFISGVHQASVVAIVTHNIWEKRVA
jgi:hypothetical protein